MPNPQASGLPNPASYDMAIPDVVVDRVTGLAWQRAVDPVASTWNGARTRCETLALAGHDDWRLPSRIELVSLVDFTRSPAIDSSTFPMTPGGFFWTASSVASQPGDAWVVLFDLGFTNLQGGISDAGLIRCVRIDRQVSSGPSAYSPTDGIVRDSGTGLTWQQTPDAGGYAWNAAGQHCATLPLAGGGWRLPTMKELQTIVDETTFSPSIDRTAFPATPIARFWTSSGAVGNPANAWYVDFSIGSLPGYGNAGNTVESPYRVRCVR